MKKFVLNSKRQKARLYFFKLNPPLRPWKKITIQNSKLCNQKAILEVRQKN